MTIRDDGRMLPAVVLAALLAAGCSQAASDLNLAPAGTCTEAGSTDPVPCMGLESGTTVMLKVEPPPDSGSTSTVPYARLVAECTDSGSTSTVPCTIVVKKK